MRILRILSCLALLLLAGAAGASAQSNMGGGGSGSGSGTFGPNYSAGGGTAQAQTVSPTGAVTNVTLVNGYQVCWLPIAANTGAAPTLAGSGTSTFTAKPITKVGAGGLTALIANDIVTTAIACAIYDGTEFQLQNPQAGIVVSSSISTGSGASAAGATATGGFAVVEATSTGWTPTAGQAYLRGSSVLDNFAVSIPLNGATETPLPVFNAVPAGSKCLQSSGVAGLIAEASGACASAPVYPVTVGGTVTSGGVPYFSSTTVESSSALLAANALMVGGGAGGAPATGNADFTLPPASHTLTGAAAGIVDLSAETSGDGFRLPYQAAVPSVNGAILVNSTNGLVHNRAGSYYFNVQAGGPGTDTTTCTNQVLTSISSHVAPTCSPLSAFVTSDYTNATTTLSNVTGLAIPLAANTNYAVSCKLIYQGSATTASMVLSSTGPASPTKISAQNTQTTTSGAGAAMYSDASDGTSFAFTLGPAAVVSTAVDLPSTLDIGIMNGANAGTFQLQAKANGAGTITIKKGSFCKWQ